MRIALIGGTKFIGRGITSELAARGHAGTRVAEQVFGVRA